jgi:glutamine synthetase
LTSALTYDLIAVNYSGKDVLRYLLARGQPFECDPRYLLKRNLQIAAYTGYIFYVSSELEYFYFQDLDVIAGLSKRS